MPRDGFSCKRGSKNGHAPDKVFCGDTILPMNALWKSFEIVLGLGLEPEIFDVCSNLSARDHRLRGHADDGPAWTQTLAHT